MINLLWIPHVAELHLSDAISEHVCVCVYLKVLSLVFRALWANKPNMNSLLHHFLRHNGPKKRSL